MEHGNTQQSSTLTENEKKSSSYLIPSLMLLGVIAATLSVIVAGYFHLPTGEFSTWSKTTEFIERPKLKSFYEKNYKFFNTTKDIFYYTRKTFELSQALYIQHKRIAHPLLLPQ